MGKKKTIIVGDVHGCLEELELLLDACNYRFRKDRLIFVGDLINRGPNSVGVLELAQGLGAECILGNHEVSFLNYLKQGRQPTKANLEEVCKQMGSFLRPWQEWISSWPYYIKEKDFLVVHAGVVPDYPLKKTPLEVLTKVRSWGKQVDRLGEVNGTPWYKTYKGKKLIVYGHWSTDGLKIRRNTIGLDSGCVWGGKLSALLLPKKQVVQVPALKKYAKPR